LEIVLANIGADIIANSIFNASDHLGNQRG
jgi:hypothetical protein